MNRRAVPVGAAAALALAWIGVRYVGGHADYAAAPRTAAAEPVAVAAVASPSAPSLERAPAAPEGAGFAASVAVQEQAPLVAAAESHVTSAPVAVVADAPARSPFADGIAVTFSDFREPAPDYAQRAVFGSDREFEPASAPAREPKADPLARMDPAAERRARLLAPALPAYASSVSHAVASDWMKSRASSNERMYESMDQGSNDRLLVGFRF